MLVAILALAALTTLLAAVQLVSAFRVARAVPALADLDPEAPPSWPRLSMIVPARNEAFGIEDALRSKLACGYPNTEIVVVDDRSTDATGSILARLKENMPELRTTRVDVLPEGWLGKLHALSVGVDASAGDWLLFSDADVHIEPGTLEKVIANAEAEGLDMIAMMPRMDPVNVALDASVNSLVRLTALLGRAWEANRDASPIGVGVGAFNLLRRSALARTPGLQHLRMEIVDDVALGAMMKASGARCRFYAARDAVHLVFAERLSVLARGSEKGGGILGFSLLGPLFGGLALLAVDLGIPFAALATGGLGAGLGALQLALVTATCFVIARHFDGPRRGVAFWPLGSLLGIAMLARSGILAWWRKAIVWRGTVYSQRDIEAGRRWIGGRVRLGA
jgi:cellulose synthase/poly-beta-1,6-N-acetylglucosamine synthase-like glycosyltransferase